MTIREEILGTADYYPASTYAFGPQTFAGVGSTGTDTQATGFAPLLTFCKEFSAISDPLSGSFIPVSSAGKNPKMFVVGVLPPNQVVTGKLLDGRALRSFKGSPIQTNPPKDTDPQVGHVIEEDPTAALSRKAEEQPPRRVVLANAGIISNLHPAFQNIVSDFLQAAAQRGIILQITEGIRTPERQDELYQQGRTTDKPIVTYASGGNSWHQYGLAIDVVPYINGKLDWRCPRETWLELGALGESMGFIWGGHFTQFEDLPHFEWHPGLTIEDAKRGKTISPGARSSSEVLADTQPSFFDPSMAAQARSEDQQSRFASSLRVPQDKNQQLRDVVAAQNALNAMAKTPPLRMLVNPSSFSIRSQKIAQDGNWSREGAIVEYWGDDKDTISGSGSLAAFFAVDAFPGLGQGGPGLTRTARNFSKSWQNFQALRLIYRNNGGVFLSDLSEQARLLLLSTVGSVYIYYDDILYIGSFTSFNVTETGEKQFSADYAFEFSVRAAFQLDLPADMAGTGEKFVQAQKANSNYAEIRGPVSDPYANTFSSSGSLF